MHPFNRSHIRVRQQGQTLIIALIVMGVLLILGLVFLGLVNRNIVNAARSQRRSESYDLAVAGVTYAHSQLVSSPAGADWRGVPTDFGAATVSGDPDAYYLRPKSGLPDDLGGPDRLGPFVRVQFPGGRSLTRVRYGATDASPTKLVPGGPLRNPGAARATLIIESVGRTGVVNPNDPTTLNAQGGLPIQGFTTLAQLTDALGRLAQADGQIPTSRRVVAYARIGIIDAARFETNVFNSSAPIDLGVASGLGIRSFNDIDPTAPLADSTDISKSVETQIGSPDAATGFGGLQAPGNGSLIANGDLALYGNLHVYANTTLGDAIRVAGRLVDGDGNPATLTVTPYAINAAQTGYVAGADAVLTSAGGPGTTGSFDSQNPVFSTASGALLDGAARTDGAGYASGVGALVPPSTLTLDPQTKLNRYVALTRESGLSPDAGNSELNGGAFGHGGGVYVDNAADRQEPADDNGRRIAGSQRSLVDDWLNPNSGAADSGWRGPFYVPDGASVQLLPNGFTIQRDGKVKAEATWKMLNGNAVVDTGLSRLRYRLGNVGGRTFIVDTTTFIDPANVAGTVDAAQDKIDRRMLSGDDFRLGVPFNGVLYFEGNVRVRGTIPTDVQLTLVSGATIYVEGSITKGIVGTEATPGLAQNATLTRLPLASLMLMAKDNVAVNTPMFFGPVSGQKVTSANDQSGATNISPAVVKADGNLEDGRLEINFGLAMDPDANSGTPIDPPDSNPNRFVPSSWQPYATTYASWDGGARLGTQLLLAETMDDGTASASFLAMDVNFGTTNGAISSQYLFDASDPLFTNTAAVYTGAGAGTPIPLYGLGADAWQRYARFETRSFPLVPDATAVGYAGGRITGLPAKYPYALFSEGNDLLIRPGSVQNVSTNDLLVGRVAVAPSEIRIEASMFAEQGSFFVIPGPWFNPDPKDTHAAYYQSVQALGKARADRARLEAFGTGPGAPFYGEPLDVRINIVGSVSENLPPPIAVQSEWVRKWGWIPRRLAATGAGIPRAHVPGKSNNDKSAYMNGGTVDGRTVPAHNFVPNIVIQYDPILATGRLNDGSATPTTIRQDAYGRPLPPMPRLPVSPKLAYFGEL